MGNTSSIFFAVTNNQGRIVSLEAKEEEFNRVQISENDFNALAQTDYTDYTISAGALVYSPKEKLPKPIELLKREIEQQRDSKLASGFTFNGNKFHSDEIFGSQLQAFIIAWQTGILAPDATVAIRLKDNVTVQMGYNDVKALAAALMQYVQQVYAESWAAKDALP